ncbi:hypothetical protein LK542_09095 [Massilia sp. IC2-477]|uniref:hypothetical protein n=1 Tax=Massilia sp. IC2-477 TaxID=2887198 RepID=UPI001D0FB9EB|nr:hypothetical protein [Massilia sp. IC2-477]MCC2955769.1 hypothetical protein [Massilia sp. IC2-477]
MLSKYKLNHIAAGLLDKFVGRDNDYQRHWALGVMYFEARAADNRIDLNLLAACANPPFPASTSLARTWAHHLRQALGRHGAALDELDAATISVEFGLPPVPKRPGYIEYGDPFLCSLRLVAKDGRVAERRRMEHCAPADEFWNSWFGPYTG